MRFSVGPEGRNFAAYLFSNPRRVHRREKLLANFWPDTEEREAKKRLNNTLSSLRHLIDKNTNSNARTVIHSTHDELMVTLPEDIVIDSVTLYDCVNREWALARTGERVLPIARLRLLETSAQSYHGHYLEECDAPWLQGERSAYFNMFIRGRILLLRHFVASSRYEEAIDQAVEILNWDDSREMVFRDLIRLYVLNHQRPMALKRYGRFVSDLSEQHGLKPMQVTQELRDAVLSGRPMGPLETYSREIGIG